MNPNLARLQSYPFQKLSALLEGATPNPEYNAIPLYIGEPKHPTPEFIKQALIDNFDGLSSYPLTAGTEALRNAIAEWICFRYTAQVDPLTEVIPVTGSREALFAFVQAVVDGDKPDPVVICPNPFYQIYEGATLLARATAYFLNALPQDHYRCNFAQVPESVWKRTQIIIVCSPGNPTGAVMSMDEWRELFALSDKYGFVIASDECYSEIHFDEAHPPLGALDVARQLGRTGYPRLVMFSSLSKRSNVPGMRSGFVAGDAAILKQYLLYRTYHGCAMSHTIQAASVVAWKDEAHVVENRRLYKSKMDAALSILQPICDVERPDAAFYLWLPTVIDDTEFARRLYIDKNVSVLPGSFLARESAGINPGRNRARIALVSSAAECVESARRIRDFIQSL